jgi:hypothetical protein
MGKKKSKIAKKKQSKTAIASKKFGVTAQKGGGREKPRTSASLMASLHAGSGGNKSATIAAQAQAPPSTNSKSHKWKKQGKTMLKAKLQKTDGDFYDQMQSLQERKAAEWNKVKQSKPKKGMKGQPHHVFEFSKPTFVVDDKDKPTDQLMAEAVHQVGAMSGITMEPSSRYDQHQQPTSSLQTALQKQRVARLWKPAPEIGSHKKSTFDRYEAHHKNHYSALEVYDNDDDDGEWNEATEATPKITTGFTLFNFAPASFSISGQSSSPTTLGISTTSMRHEAEIDPDL